MDVIGQNADRNRLEGTALLNQPIGVSKSLYLSNQQVIAAISDRDRKEKGTAWVFGAPIFRHRINLVENLLAGTLRFARPTARSASPLRRSVRSLVAALYRRAVRDCDSGSTGCPRRRHDEGYARSARACR